MIRTTLLLGGLIMTTALCTVRANLLTNGSFETDQDGDGVADGWYVEVHEGAEGHFALSSDARHGRVSQEIVHENDVSAWVRLSVLRIPVQSGALCRVSSWVKAEGPWIITLYEFLRDGTYLTHRVAGGGNTPWQRVAGTVQLTDGADYVKLSLITEGKGRAWFDDTRVEDLSQAPAIRVPELAAAPQIDGLLDEDAWSGAAVADGFLLLGGDGKAPGESTRVRLGMVDRKLYIGWDCGESRMNEQRIEGEAGWHHDTVEIFLIPPDAPVIFHVGVTPAGGRLEQVQRVPGGGNYFVDWYSRETTGQDAAAMAAPAYRCAAQRGENGWTAEMVLDLSERDARGVAQSWRLQLARSRKVESLEENSAWSYIPGSKFLDPERFGRVAFPLAAVAELETVEARPFVPERNPLLVPAPKDISWSDGAPLPLPLPIRVAHAGEHGRAGAELLVRLLGTYLGLNAEVAADGAGAAIRIETSDLAGLDELADWQRDEAYELDSGGSSTVIRAQGLRGTLYAVHTLRQLLSTDGTRVFVARATVRDWPDLRWRGWHLIGPETGAAVDDARKVLDIMAALKLNWVSFQIDNRMIYDRDPALSRSENAPTKEDYRTLSSHARSLGMEVIPMTQCWSHFNYFTGKETYRHFAEIPDPPADARRKYWNYCPRHPEVHDLVFGLIEEQLEAFPEAKYFHVGLDEITFEPIGQCPRCKGATGGELLAEEIGRLHTFLKSKGLRMCMWGDQLLMEHNGKYFQTAEALPEVPRDVIIFDWHYGATARFPSVKFFMDKGFDVVASGWYEPLNVLNFAGEAQRQDALGYGGTTWYAIQRIRDEVRLLTGIVLTGEATWNEDGVDPEALGYQPAQVFRSLWERPARPLACTPIPIQGAANAMIIDQPPRGGWMGLGTDHAVSQFPTGTQWFDGVAFDILPASDPHAIMLAGGDDGDERYPRDLWHLPVGVKADALALLQTCTRPKAFARHIYDRNGINPGRIATVAVRYADGTSDEIALSWNVTMSDWNSQLGSAYGKTAWKGETEAGALVRIEMLRWKNPHPDKTIDALTVTSAVSTVRPAILAITALQTPP